MKIKLEALKGVAFYRGRNKNIYRVQKGDVLQAEFRYNGGVSFLLNNCWSFEYAIDDIKEDFKVYNQ